MTIQKAIDLDLAFGQYQRSILNVNPAGALDGDRGYLLIEQSEGEHSTIRNRIRDLVFFFCLRSGVGRSLHRLIKLPAGDGRESQGKRLANLQELRMSGITRNNIAVHIHIVHGDFDALELRIVEVQYVLRFVSAKNELFLHLVREELESFIFRADKLRIVHGRGLLNDGKRVIADLDVYLCVCDGNVMIILQNIIHRIMRLTGLYAVVEGNHILRFIQLERNALLTDVRTIVRDGHSLLGDLLINGVTGAAHHFVGREGLGRAFLIIMDRILERLLGPVGIDGGIGLDLGVPVKGITICRIPTIEGVTHLGRICRRLHGLLILGNGLIFNCGGATVQVEGDGEVGSNPLGVERQVVAGHLVKGIGILQSGIRIPAAPGVVTVVDGGRVGRLLRRIVIGIGVDVRLEIDVADGSQVRAAEVVVDLVLRTVIIETPCIFET